MEKIVISDSLLGDVFYANQRIALPPKSKYSAFAFYVPQAQVKRKEDGTAVIEIDKYRYTLLKSKKQRLKATFDELKKLLNGEEIEKIPYDIVVDKDKETRFRLLENNIPKELQELPNWCVYLTKWNDEKGKMDKTIISAKTGAWAKSNDKSTWTDFKTAVAYATKRKFNGVAFALDGSGITCIDIDHSIDKGKISPLAKDMMQKCSNSYIETSVSGNGIHIFLKDDVLESGKYKNRAIVQDGEIEVYDKGRIISMTGNNRNEICTIEPCDESTKKWLQETLGTKTVERKFEQRDFNKSDDALIESIRRSQKSSDFDSLMNGISLTGDHSRDDYKMLNILAFFSDGNLEQMERIFRCSGLYRPDKGDKYLHLSAQKAIDTLPKRMHENTMSMPKIKVKENNNEHE